MLVNKLRKTINTKTVGDLCQSFNSLLKQEIEQVMSMFPWYSSQYNIGEEWVCSEPERKHLAEEE